MAIGNEFVYGYHGCSRDVADKVLSGRGANLNSSENDYDWLGSGIYFWEEGPKRALEWAQQKFGFEKAAVIGAKIRLGHCLNLMDVDSYGILRKTYLNLVKRGLPLPKNGKLLHRLDCAVINSALLHAETVAHDPYDTVRCPFVEGVPVFPDSKFYDHSHIQISVRTPQSMIVEETHEERGQAPEFPRVGQAPEPPGGAGGDGGSGESPVPCLPPVLTALGDIGLLGSPFLLHVRLTLKKTVAEHMVAIDEIVEKAKRGYIPVSGFISPGEKEALRRLKAEPRVRFVKLVPFALPPRYDPSAEDSRELAADRMAIVSLQPETAAIRSIDILRSQSAAHAFRANCLAMNDLAVALCGRRCT